MNKHNRGTGKVEFYKGNISRTYAQAFPEHMRFKKGKCPSFLLLSKVKFIESYHELMKNSVQYKCGKKGDRLIMSIFQNLKKYCSRYMRSNRMLKGHG